MRLLTTGAMAILVTAALAAGTALAADEASTADPSWDDVPALKLWRAVATGKVQASGASPRSYTQLEVTVRNRDDERVVVDLAGSHLRPQSLGSCQRLGLGPPATLAAVKRRGPGTACVELEPGEERTIVMNTCCLDAGKPAPRSQRFVAVAKKLPEVRETVLRWWTDNPTVPQSAVNSAIWRNRDTVVVPAAKSSSPNSGWRSSRARGAASHAGVYYQLKNGELTSLDSEGVRRILGTQIDSVFPTADAVYAVMPGEDHLPDLWRLAPTGENPWGFVTDLEASSKLLDVVPAGDGDLVLLYVHRVSLFDKESRQTKVMIELRTTRYLSAHADPAKGFVDVTVHDPRNAGIQRAGGIEGQSAGRFEIWRVNARKGKAEMRERFWNVSSIAAGTAGIYGLSHKGVVRRVQNGKFKDLGTLDVYRAIVAVGKDRIWLLDPADHLVAVRAANGRRLFASKSPVGLGDRVDVDPVTDDLVYCSNSGFFVVRGTDGSSEKLPERSDDS